MLNRLFGKSRAVSDETTTPQGAVSPDTRLYVVGDIHGCLDLLSELQQLIHRRPAMSWSIWAITSTAAPIPKVSSIG
jgi:hypothetical protein